MRLGTARDAVAKVFTQPEAGDQAAISMDHSWPEGVSKREVPRFFGGHFIPPEAPRGRYRAFWRVAFSVGRPQCTFLHSLGRTPVDGDRQQIHNGAS